MKGLVIENRVVDHHRGVGVTMPELELALDCRYMQPKLAALTRTPMSTNSSIQLSSSKIVRHKPGRRCIIRYELDTRGGRSIHRQALLGKVRARGFDRKTYELTRRLWRGKFGPDCADAIRVPEPVGAIPELNMWLQRRIEADTLAEQLDEPNAIDLCYLAAVALYKLHSNGPKPERQHSVTDEIRILNKGLDDAKSALICFSERIDRVQKACEEMSVSLGGCEVATIHRDFYPNQLLVKRGAVWLLDLDLYAEGDPAVDTGNFVAHLQETSLRRFGHCHGYSHLETAFLHGYRSASGSDLSLSIQRYVTLTLVRHIAISRRLPSRHRTTEALIRTCEQRLGLSSAGYSLQ